MIELKVNTTQNVNITFIAASLGDRILAFVMDYFLIVSYLVMMMYIAEKLGLFDLDLDNWSRYAIISLIALPAFLYTLVSEILMEGQTLGKKVIKIKVIKLDGYQASFLDYIIRWVFRLIDIYLGFGTGGIAILSIAISKNSQRLGDMSAGTAVISLKDKYFIDHTILENLDNDYQPHYQGVINLSDKDVQFIKDIFSKATVKKDYVTLTKLRIKIEELTQTSRGDRTDIQFIDTILKDYNHFTQNM